MEPQAIELLRAMRMLQELPPSRRAELLVTAAHGDEGDAMAALEQLVGHDDGSKWPALAAIAADGHRPTSIRVMALRELAGWSDDLRLLSTLRPFLSDPSLEVRRAAAAALPPASRDNMALLDELAQDSDAEVRAIVAGKRALQHVLERLERRHEHELLCDWLAEREAWLLADPIGTGHELPAERAKAVLGALWESLADLQSRRRRRLATYGGGYADTYHESDAELMVPPGSPAGDAGMGARLPVRITSVDGEFAGFKFTTDGTAITGRIIVPWGDGQSSGASFRGGVAVVVDKKQPDVVIAWGRILPDEDSADVLFAECHGALPEGHSWSHVRARHLPGEALAVSLIHPKFHRRGKDDGESVD